MITVNVADLPALTAEQAAFEIGTELSEFARPGLYRVDIESRGEIDFIEYLGNDATFDVQSVEEVVEQELAAFEEFALEEEVIEEFYVAEMDEVGFVFSYTEEGYNLYIRVV